MAKFSGKIGFIKTVETSPGEWTESVEERIYYGDLTRQNRRWDPSSQINDNISFNQDISVLADPYAFDNYQNMRYVIFHGAKWRISSITIEYPRIVISTGGVYNA